jgi:hypothetical protein
MDLDCCAPGAAFPLDYINPSDRLDPYQHVGRLLRLQLDEVEKAAQILLADGWGLIPPKDYK